MLILLLGQPQPTSTERVHTTTPVTLSTQARTHSTVPVLLRPTPGRNHTRVSVALPSNLQAAALPAPELPSGDTVIPPAPLFIINHAGLMSDAVDYSISVTRSNDGTRKPTLRIRVRGDYQDSGTFMVIVTAQSPTGHGSYRQAYGPFMITSRVVSEAPTGTTTELSSTDTTAADAERLYEELMGPLNVEFLPWEAAKGYTPYEQVVIAKNKALSDREAQKALQHASCKAKKAALNQVQSVSVHALIYWVLDGLPLPWVLTAPLPYLNDAFYSVTDTGVMVNGGELQGVSYQTYGKKPLDVLRDILGKVGWIVQFSGGIVYLGPPPALSSGFEQSAAALGIPLELLTAKSREYINTSPETARMTTPRRYDLTGASIKKYLPPLPKEEEDPVLTFESDPNGSLSEQQMGWRDLSQTVLDYVSTSLKLKKNGNLVLEETNMATWVPAPPADDENISTSGEGETRQPAEYWSDRANSRKATYVYAHPLFPHAETHQTISVETPVQLLGRTIETEYTTVSSLWHDEGWLQGRITTTKKLDGWQKITHTEGAASQTEIFPIIYYTTTTEQWTPLGRGSFQRKLTKKSLHYQPIVVDGLIDNYYPVAKIEVSTDSDAPPQTDVKQDCPEDMDKGFEYTEPLSLNVPVNGRADPVSVNVPWATSLDPQWVDWLMAAAGNRPSIKTTYTLMVPPRIDIGDIVQSMNGSGKAGSFQGQVVIEEAYGN